MHERVGSLGVAPWKGRLSHIVPYAILAVAFVLVASYGTAVYNYFIPTVVQQRDFSAGLWVLAIIAGVAGFLSPCAFGMLPAYFALFLSVDRSSPSRTSDVGKALRYGLAAALGMVTVAVVLAILIITLGATFAPGLRVITPIPNPYTRALRILAGILLVVLGILQWRGRSIASALAGPIARARGHTHYLLQSGRVPSLLFFQFGILYVLVALPCVANVMAAPLLASLATRGIGGMVVTEFLFLLTMGTLMLTVSIFIGLADQTVVARLGESAPTVLRLASIILILMGLVLVYLDIDLALFRSIFFRFPIR